MKPHKKLAALKKSMELVEKLYKLTNAFPREEVPDLRRKSVVLQYLSLPISRRVRQVAHPSTFETTC